MTYNTLKFEVRNKNIIHDSREVTKILGIQGMINMIRDWIPKKKSLRVGEIKQKRFSGVDGAWIRV